MRAFHEPFSHALCLTLNRDEALELHGLIVQADDTPGRDRLLTILERYYMHGDTDQIGTRAGDRHLNEDPPAA